MTNIFGCVTEASESSGPAPSSDSPSKDHRRILTRSPLATTNKRLYVVVQYIAMDDDKDAHERDDDD